MKKIINLIKKLFRYRIYLFHGGVAYARHLGVVVGEGSRVLTTNFGSEPFLITIGDKTTITSGVILLTHDGSTWLMRDKKGRRYKYNRIIVGSNVFIGVNAIVLPGVEIEDRVIVAAGSVVTKSIPSNSIVGGNPAKIIGSYDDYERRALSTYISDEEMDKTLPYKEKILKVLDKDMKKFIKKKS